MGVQLENFGVQVPGPVRRKQDKDTDITTLTFNVEQARAAYETLGQVLQFVDGNAQQTEQLPLGNLASPGRPGDRDD